VSAGTSGATGAATSRRRDVVTVWVLRLTLLAAVVGAWIYGTGAGDISRLILPPLHEVLGTFPELFTSEFIWEAIGVTLFEMVAAFLIAGFIGMAVGFFLSRSPRRAETFEPLLAWGYMFPFVLLYPLFLLWIGVGLWSKIAYAAASAFFPIAYNTLRGLRAVDQKYVKVGRAFGASRFDMDRHIKAGAARPMIMSGLRVGISVVMIAVVLAELLGSSRGLGYELQRAASTLQLPEEYAIAILLLTITVLLQRVLERFLRG
jgi:ABC-type nitrate/sulfonate/bicarbonate transport system permease component